MKNILTQRRRERQGSQGSAELCALRAVLLIAFAGFIIILLPGCASVAGTPSPECFIGYVFAAVIVASLVFLGVVLYCELQRDRFFVMFLLAVLTVVAVVLLAGCAHDNGIIIKGSEKSTTAENIEAGGKVAAGAWKTIFNKQ